MGKKKKNSLIFNRMYKEKKWIVWDCKVGYIWKMGG